MFRWQVWRRRHRSPTRRKNVAVLFACSAKASDGTLTVPVSVLGQMPVSSADPLATNTGALLVVKRLG